MKIHCAHNALVDPATLKPNPVNPNRHSAHQIQLLASIIQEQGWRGPITVSKRSGLIVRGHGRLEAALLMGAEIDVSEVAREAGLKFPVYLTRAVWENYVRVPEDVRCQDESGRLWDLVWMLRVAARRTSGPQMLFGLHVRNDNRDRTPPLVTLKAVCGPRDIDDPQPAITVMLVDED